MSSYGFCNLMSSYGYTNVISKPTQITSDHAYLLYWTTYLLVMNFSTSDIIMKDLSKHLPIFTNLSLTNQVVQKSQKQIFDMNKIPEPNHYLLKGLADFQNINYANAACEVLVGTFTKGINQFTRNIKPCRRTPLKPWISPGILCSINNKK